MKDITTQLVTLGREKKGEGFPAVNPPIYRTSTVLFPTMNALEQATAGLGKIPSYGRYGSPTAQHLCDALDALIGSDITLITSSGLSAVTTALLAALKAGDHLLMVDNVYGPTRLFCDQVLARMGIETTYFVGDAGAAEIEPLLRENTRVIFLESPGSQTFEMQDMSAISTLVKPRDILVIADVTWPTPLYFRPFEHGIDIAIHSLTKYVSGHSDLLMGAVSCLEPHKAMMRRTWLHLGAHASNDDCYLALRGLRTLSVRVKQHESAALEVAKWLKQQPQVKRVMHPALHDDAGYERYKRHFTGSCGLFGVELHPVRKEAIAAMLDELELFGMGYSWGGYESLIIPVYPAKIRTASQWPAETLCLRLHIGLESVPDLLADLEKGLARLSAAA
ncbi:MAG: cystathionine beta-lyase [Rickettsiales bacterium]|nr:cystathionine beta-lyase [Rickettsiales bacterium]